MVNDRLNSEKKRTVLGLVAFVILASCDLTPAGNAQSLPAAQIKQLATSAAKAASSGSKEAAAPSTPKAKGKEEPAMAQGADRRNEPNPPDAETASEDEGLPPVAGRRDPFRLPPPPAVSGKSMGQEPSGPLPPGVRGLVIGQLRLEGTVRQEATNTMIAVVTNYTNRAYFLHENDAVYNGVVTKISPDAVYFKENVLDSNGRVTTREVIRRLGQAAGEGR